LDFILPDPPKTADSAPSLACYNIPSLAHRIAKLAQGHPLLASRLLCCPREAMHCYAIFLQCHAEHDDAVNAQIIYDTDPRTLLLNSIDEPAKELFSTLKKCEPQAHTMAFYRTLDGLLKCRFAAELMECTEINIKVLQFFNTARRWNFDPLVVAAHRLLGHQINRAMAFHDIVGIMRALDVLDADRLERRVLRNWKKSLHQYIDARLQGVVSPVAFDLAPPLAQISDAKQLKRLALTFENCLGTMDHRVRLASGNHLLIHLNEPHAEHLEGAVAVLELGAGGLWYISDAEHAKGVECSPDVRNRIVELLGQAGVKAAPRTFVKAMRFFANAPDLMSW